MNKLGTIPVRPGESFKLWLPDGTILEVEQTSDDFTLRRQSDGFVCYTQPTSVTAKHIESAVEERSGFGGGT